MAVAVMQRVGYAQLWYLGDTVNNYSNVAIGPMNAPSGSPTAIDPCFLVGEITYAWNGTADDGTSLAVTNTLKVTWDMKYQDAVVEFNGVVTDTNVSGLTLGVQGTSLRQDGFGSGFSVPPNYTSSHGTVYTYDTGNLAYQTGHGVTNGSLSCSGTASYSSWSNFGQIVPALTITWSLTNPVAYKDYVKLCDQLLQAITLLDSIAAPTKTYSIGSSLAGPFGNFYFRYPLDFLPLVSNLNVGGFRCVGNSFVANYDRGLSPSFGGYFAQIDYLSMNDGGQANTFYNGATIGTGVMGDWTNIFTMSTTPGAAFNTTVNCQNNPLFAHGCPFIADIPIDMKHLAGTPSAPTDNVSCIFSLKSAFVTNKVTSSKAWVYNPSTNAWTLNTFSPTNSASSAGNFIYDPVNNLATADVPAGYVLDPSGGLYTVDGTAPFTAASVDTTFGFVTGSF